ncbi:MAG: PA14 domain-containing protein [Chitinophagales bacterium]
MSFKRLLTLLSIITLSFIAYTCSNSQQSQTSSTKERPHDPWVFRSVLDKKARMVTLALDKHLWAAYDAERCALYKVWRNGVDFDGAVYTTAHGPQPTALGDSYIVSESKNPWRILQNGQESEPTPAYKGHRYEGGQAYLMYELKMVDGKSIAVTEMAEHAENGHKPIFQRTFTTSNVPDGVEVMLLTDVSSIAAEKDIDTDGKFEVISTKERALNSAVKGVDIAGKLTLENNGTTHFNVTFIGTPMIVNEDEAARKASDEEMPAGARLIAKNDCKTCHNTYKQTIGPAYMKVARKYKTTPERIEFLANKIIKGGGGVWGTQVMSPHPDLMPADAATMAEYILKLDGEDLEEGADTIDFQPVVYVYDFGEKTHNALPPFESLSMNHRFKVGKIDFDENDFEWVKQGAGLVFDGYLDIKKTDNYVFRLQNNYMASLSIDGKELANHNSGKDEKSTDIELEMKAGYHSFRIEYYRPQLPTNLHFSWAPHGQDKFEPVSDKVLMHLVADEAPVVPSEDSGDKTPGDGIPVKGVHPSYDLCQARPDDFLPKVAGMDFLSDGRLVISTWDPAGRVLILDGVQGCDASKITVKTIAQGLAEPLGLKVVDDEIYVLQKQELTKLVDIDGDEIIDEYQTVSNQWRVSANFHEFAFGLVYKDGYFYATLATAINPGGASTQPQIPDRGKVVKISKADGSSEFIASGLRTPNGIGLGVDNEIYVADNQGDWLPASKIVHIREGAWYGSRSVDFEGTANLEEALPVVWLTQDEIGNSPSQPTVLNDGVYKGQMIHGEVTHGGLKRVFAEKVNGQYQGVVFRFTQGLEAGVNRVVWGPDGALYMGLIGNPGNWSHTGGLWYGLQRMKFNEKPTFEMLAVRAKPNGMEIEFTEPLKESDGNDAADYDIKQWRFEPTPEYGGPKLDEENLKVVSVKVSDDRKKVFLELAGMKAKHVVYVHLTKHWTSANNNELWSTEAWYTLNQIPQDGI